MNYKFIEDITLLELTARKYTISGIDNKKLAEEVLQYINIRKSKDNNSGLSEDSLFEIPEGSEGLKLINIVNEIAKEKGLVNVNQWGQIHRPLESTNTHHHGESPFAWTYYVQIPPGAGSITFSFLDRFRYSIPPEDGTLIIFPGWMNHSVSKNIGDEIRISVAGNLEKEK
jgi:Putative 2OG-Fe(II) oxygenase